MWLLRCSHTIAALVGIDTSELGLRDHMLASGLHGALLNPRIEARDLAPTN